MILAAYASSFYPEWMPYTMICSASLINLYTRIVLLKFWLYLKPTRKKVSLSHQGPVALEVVSLLYMYLSLISENRLVESVQWQRGSFILCVYIWGMHRWKVGGTYMGL